MIEENFFFVYVEEANELCATCEEAFAATFAKQARDVDGFCEFFNVLIQSALQASRFQIT